MPIVYDELVDLRLLGQTEIRRASHVEPTTDGRWVQTLRPLAGPQLGPFSTRSQALSAEVAWLHIGSKLYTENVRYERKNETQCEYVLGSLLFAALIGWTTGSLLVFGIDKVSIVGGSSIRVKFVSEQTQYIDHSAFSSIAVRQHTFSRRIAMRQQLG